MPDGVCTDGTDDTDGADWSDSGGTDKFSLGVAAAVVCASPVAVTEVQAKKRPCNASQGLIFSEQFFIFPIRSVEQPTDLPHISGVISASRSFRSDSAAHLQK